ncbi:MAG: hypothetical protein DRQ99_26525 [Candidatus Parabeggiatoa sp. nov. 3]|jgi:hypothetical protein|nr:MAG: hypothetical protein DRQ99_26525 [Gammaproteobacteria bacterium]
MKYFLRLSIATIALMFATLAIAQSANQRDIYYAHHRGMVVTGEEIATQIGVKILKKGANAGVLNFRYFDDFFSPKICRVGKRAAMNSI